MLVRPPGQYQSARAGVGLGLALLTGAITAVPGAGAQTAVPEAPGAAVATISAAAVARYAAELAADSLRERDTPSPALERTAQYVAAQLARLGLTPAGKEQWFNRPPLPSQLRVDVATAALNFGVLADSVPLVDSVFTGWIPARFSTTMTASLAKDAYYSVPVLPMYDDQQQGTVLVAGPHTVASLAQLQLRYRIVFYVPPAGLDAAAQQQLVDQLYQQSLGVVVLDADSSAFAAAHAAARAHPPRVIELYLDEVLQPRGWVVHVWSGAFTKLLAAAGADLARLPAADTPVVQALRVQMTRPSVTVELSPEAPRASAVVGKVMGRDSALGWNKREAVVVLAHMDRGRDRENDPRQSGDSLQAEAADSGVAAGDHRAGNPLGVTALLALAEAFSQPAARPLRTVYFAVTSGSAGGSGTPDFWGTLAVAFDLRERIVSVLNLDALGRGGSQADLGATDSVVVAGSRDIDSVTMVNWLATAHPELRLTVVDGGSAFVPTSAHYGFSRRRLPLLYFHAGAGRDTSPEAAGAGQTVTGGEADRVARIARLAFYTAWELAESPRRPALNAAGRQHFLESMGRGKPD